MSDDIVTRLRQQLCPEWCDTYYPYEDRPCDCGRAEAAAEIERLRADQGSLLDALSEALDFIHDWSCMDNDRDLDEDGEWIGEGDDPRPWAVRGRILDRALGDDG